MATVAFIGNFTRSWCSEVHWAQEMRSLGHTVVEFQEPARRKDHNLFLRRLNHWVTDRRPDLVMYTRTWGLPPETTDLWRQFETLGIVTFSYHLDLYVGLPRQGTVTLNDPFWTTQYVFTADGDPDSHDWFTSQGINHHWLSPAVLSDECIAGTPRDDYSHDIVFVGSDHYHPEWPWRPALIRFLTGRYGDRFRRYNSDMPGGVVRGLALNDLYASAKIVVGDTLHLPGHANYWSDRYFETIGRGGFLLAPHIEGLDGFLTDKTHYAAYQHPVLGGSTRGALNAVGDKIDFWLDHPDERHKIQLTGQAHVFAHHTYRNRLTDAFNVMGFGTTPAAVERLELGSGYSPTEGFTHLDINPAAPGVDIVAAAWPLTLSDGSVGELRAVDVLEHLSYWDTDQILADWFRVLRPGGKIYIQVPDADTIMRWYVDDPDLLTTPKDLPQTPLAGAAWRLLGGHSDGVCAKEGDDFRWNAHYALFSVESIRHHLETAGFIVDSVTINAHPNLLVYAHKPDVVRRPSASVHEIPPKIGLIARSEVARGLALMTKGFYDHMPVDRVLVAKLPHRDCDLAPEWFPGATEINVGDGYKLDQSIVRPWLEGLDVVYTCETPYDWRMVDWCRELGVKLVVHGMPEFVRHGQPNCDWKHPNEWWWPTSWRLEHLPPGVVVPVPMPDHEPTASLPDEPRMRIYHIVGKRAAFDRNGTDTLIEALRALDTHITVTMCGLEHSLPQFTLPRKLDVILDDIGPADRWDMHRGQHLLVLPRRYAGLCLPALEAASRGIAVMMPDVSPNAELASVLVPASLGRVQKMPCGPVQTYGLHFFALAQEINALYNNRDRLREVQKRSYDMTPRWSEYRQVYLDHFTRVCNT